MTEKEIASIIDQSQDLFKKLNLPEDEQKDFVIDLITIAEQIINDHLTEKDIIRV